MSLKNLTKKEKIGLTIITVSFIGLIISAAYLFYFSDILDLNYYSKNSYEQTKKTINYNFFANIILILSFFIFISLPQFLASGRDKFFYQPLFDEFDISKNYEISKLSIILGILLIFIIAILLFNENVYNHVFSNQSQKFIDNIINEKGILEENIERVQFYVEIDTKRNILRAISIPAFCLVIAHSISSLLIWKKYR